MRHIFSPLIRLFIEQVLPPRRTEQVVRALTLSHLQAISRPNGALPYKDSGVRALVWELKYQASAYATQLAAVLLHERIVEAAEEEVGALMLVPVPMHEKRRKVRGHNQTELLCAEIAKLMRGSVTYEPRALLRVRYTHSQQGLPRHKRLHNVAGSMEAAPLVRGRTCLVIDDVSTTGATLAEARRALHEAGASRVFTFALAE